MKKKMIVFLIIFVIIFGIIIFLFLNKDKENLYQTYEGDFFECGDSCEIVLNFGGKKNKIIFSNKNGKYNFTFNKTKLFENVSYEKDYVPNYYYAFDNILVLESVSGKNFQSKISIYNLDGKEVKMPNYESLFDGFEGAYENIRLNDNKFIVTRDKLIDLDLEVERVASGDFYIYSCDKDTSESRGFFEDTKVYKEIEFIYENNVFSKPKETLTKNYKNYLIDFNVCDNTAM